MNTNLSRYVDKILILYCNYILEIMMTEYFKTRNSVRTFSNKDVPVALVKDLLEIAIHAPNTGNMQWYSVVITKNPVIKEQLEKCHFNQPASVNANVLVTFCIDINRFEKWCKISKATPGFNNFQSFIAAAIDTSILAQQFTTLAELHQLGTCILGTTTYNAPEIGKILNLPAMVIPLTTIALGYRDSSFTPTERLPVDAVIHNETYHNYTDEDVAEYYKEKENLDENKRFVAENDKETLAQVFTDIRYPKNNNEVFSEKYIDYIEKQGFPIKKK